MRACPCPAPARGLSLETVMALSFDFSKVDDYKAVTIDPANEENWHPVADALVWLSMLCGYGEITEKNVHKVTARIMAYQAVAGAYLRYKGEPVYVTPEDIRRFIGLRTNASTMTDKQWQTRLGGIAVDAGGYLRNKLTREECAPALVKVAQFAQQAKAG